MHSGFRKNSGPPQTAGKFVSLDEVGLVAVALSEITVLEASSEAVEVGWTPIAVDVPLDIGEVD